MKATSPWSGISSRLFVVGVLLLSLVLFYVAELIGEEEHTALYGTLSHLAAMLLAAFVAAAFLSFRDVREMMSASISSLLVDGRIAEHLSSTMRTRLRRALLLEEISAQAKHLEPEVLEHVEAIERQVLTLPHHHSYSATITLSDIDGHPDLLRRHSLTSYKVSTRHCKDEKALYRLVVSTEISNLPGTLSKEQLLKGFSVRAGAHTFSEKDASVEATTSAGVQILHVALEKELEIEREAEVLIEYETQCSRSDPTEIRTVRYPTSGFRFSLVYRDDCKYDVAWFRATAKYPKGATPLSRETVEVTPKGIAAFTHKWLLPGDGVVLIWYR